MRFTAVAIGGAFCLAPVLTEAYHRPSTCGAHTHRQHACRTRAAATPSDASAGENRPQQQRAMSRRGVIEKAAAGAASGGAFWLSRSGAAFADDEAPAPAAEASAAAAPAAEASAAAPVEEASAASPVQEVAVPKSAAEKAAVSAFDFTMPYNGKQIPVGKLLGPKATLVINGKLDDPAAMQQMPDIVNMANKYGREGLHVIVVPTDQGYFEADEDRVVKIKFYQFYGFGQYPVAVVTDKVDIVGNTAHPLYKYLCRSLKNPNGIARITLNFEKFLLGADGRPLRRYPRQLALGLVEDDIAAAVRGAPLPPPGRPYATSWVKAQAEAERSEYAFKLGLNYYNNVV